MALTEDSVRRVLEGLATAGLLPRDEATRAAVTLLEAPELAPLREASRCAHLHLKVTSVAALPTGALEALGARVVRAYPGYAKYDFSEECLHAAFSEGPTSEELARGLAGAALAARPLLDHLGFDLRDDEDPAVLAAFAQSPALAQALGWGHAAQGEAGSEVQCCGVAVLAKHWLFPRGGAPVEVALGAPRAHGGAAQGGLDARPVAPRRGLRVASCC